MSTPLFRIRNYPGGGGTPMMNPHCMCLSIGPRFWNCHYPDRPPFLLCWPILNSMTPFFTFLEKVLNDPHFYHFHFTQLPPPPNFSSKSYYPMALPFFTVAFVYLSTCCFNLLVLNDPLFTTGYQMTPSLAGFYTPKYDPYTIFCTWYGMAWFLLGLFTEWPHILESTHFTCIGPYFWLGVGTYLSLRIGSASPPPGKLLWTQCPVSNYSFHEYFHCLNH